MKTKLRLYKFSDYENEDDGILGIIAETRNQAKYIGINEFNDCQYINARCCLYKFGYDKIIFDKPRIITNEEGLRSGLYYNTDITECGCDICKSKSHKYGFYGLDGKVLCSDCYDNQS